MNIDPEEFFKQNHPDLHVEKLPYPDTLVPEYRMGAHGRWELSQVPVPVLRGYFNGIQMVKHRSNLVLRRKTKAHPNGEVWMSLTPMEMESMMPMIAAAEGRVLVVGLGMGVYLYNVLQKPEVEEVIVIEKDPMIETILRQRAGMLKWPGHEKLRAIIHADCFGSRRAKGEFDHMYVDIWPTLGSEEARGDVVRVAQRQNTKTQSWWGMELDFIEWCTTRVEEGTKLTEEQVTEFAPDWADSAVAYGLDLRAITRQREWARLALRAAYNVTQY
jgi:hypothetical protein